MPSVLIVEDEYLVRVGLRTCIDWQQHGYTLLEDAFDGKDAYERILQNRPDILLLDIKMPRMDGFSLLECLKAEGIEPSCIILSCCDDFESVRKAMHLGVVDYLNKLSLNPQELLEVLRKIPAPKTLQVRSDSPLAVPLQSLEQSLSAYLQNQGGSLPNEPIFHCGRVAYIRFTQHTQVRPPSVNVQLQMVSQVLKASGLPCVVCGNENDNVAVLLPQDIDPAVVSNLIKQQVEPVLNVICSFGFSPVYKIQAELFPYYELAAQIEYETFYQMTGNVYVFTKFHTLESEQRTQFFALCQKLQQQLFAHNLQATGKLIHTFCKAEQTPFLLAPTEFIQLSLSLLEFLRPYVPENAYYHSQTKLVAAGCIEQVQKEFETLQTLCVGRAGGKISPNIQKVVDYILLQNNRFVSLSEAAKYAHISESYLSQLFKKEMGESFISFEHRYKVELAKELLQSQLRVYEVCDRIGFENPNYFSKIFKRYVGLTPNEYKSQLGRHLVIEETV